MNYAFKTGKDLPEIPENRILEGHNFNQHTPHTKIYEEEKGLTFRKCDLQNCDLPEDAKIENCWWAGTSISRCSHLHKGWIPLGLAECPENCQHVTGMDEIKVDGKTVDTVYYYEDKII